MPMSANRNAANLSIAIVKTLARAAGFGLAADIAEGGQEFLNLLADIKNDALDNPNAEMIRSLNSAVKSEIKSIEGALKQDGMSKKLIKDAVAQLSEAARHTIKDLAEDDDALIRAVQQPKNFGTELKRHTAPRSNGFSNSMQAHYTTLLDRISQEFLILAPWSPNFNRIALASLLRCFPDLSERIDRLEQHMDRRFDHIELGMREDRDIHIENNQLLKGLSRQNASPTFDYVVFGSRPDVVVEDRFVPRGEQEQLNALITDPTRRRTVLVGMRGCGKTQLASTLAQQCEDAHWSLVAWVNASSTESITSDLVELAKELKKELKIDTSDQPTPEDIIRRLFTRLKSADPSDRLIVFDNVENIDDLSGLVPRCKGLRVVATTTNNAGWEHHDWKTIKVGVFDRSESIDYLLTVTRCDDHDAADALAQRLGDLPLAIAQAAGTARHKDLSLARYLKRLDSRSEELDIHHNLGDEYTDDVATVLWMAVEAAVDSMKNGTKHMARRQLGALALLAESGVPTRWLDPTIEQQDDRELQGAHQADDEDAHDALTELIHRSIVQQSADKATTMLHRLQAQVLRESWTEKERRDANESSTAVLSRVTTNMDRGNNTDSRRHDTLDLIEQLRAVSAQKYSQCLLAESATQNCLFQAFEQAFELGVPQHAVNLSAAVSLFNSIENVEPSDALALQNQLGCAYEAAGDYDTAIRLHSEVLAAYEQMIDIDADEILISRNNLATAYKANRNIPKAIEILEGTFKDAYQRYGLEHEQTIGSLNNLAETYTQVYEPDIILPMFIVAFELSKKILNPADDISLAIRNNLALAYLKMGDATKAISEFTSLLQDRQRFRLDRHVEHLITLRNLAEAHEANGDMEKAISTLKKARAEGTELHGDHHLETLWTVNSLGCAYLQDNQFQSARLEFESALAKCDEFLDYNHPLTTTIRTNLEYVERLLATTSESGPTTRRNMD